MDWLEDDTDTTETTLCSPWKIAIVDDDPEVHKITQISLNGFEFEGRKLEFLHAYSGTEAKTLFANNNDIAMVLLDVVMEEEHAGLGVVKYIREKLHNHYTRVILRTGQPGSAPEEDVIRDYDIDGYKSKTEFTRKNLSMLIYTSLRSYRDVVNIQQYQRGLEAVIHALRNLSELNHVEEFAAALMSQLAVVLNSSHTEFIMQDSEAFALAQTNANRWHIMANEHETESFKNGEKTKNNEAFVAIAERALTAKESLLEPPLYAHYYRSKQGVESVFILRNSQLLSDFNRHLLEIFSQNAVLTLEHLVKTK